MRFRRLELAVASVRRMAHQLAGSAPARRWLKCLVCEEPLDVVPGELRDLALGKGRGDVASGEGPAAVVGIGRDAWFATPSSQRSTGTWTRGY